MQQHCRKTYILFLYIFAFNGPYRLIFKLDTMQAIFSMRSNGVI